jgi:hypothetical protein
MREQQYINAATIGMEIIGELQEGRMVIIKRWIE